MSAVGGSNVVDDNMWSIIMFLPQARMWAHLWREDMIRRIIMTTAKESIFISCYIQPQCCRLDVAGHVLFEGTILGACQLREFLKIWHKYGAKDQLIKCWWLEVIGKVHCDLLNKFVDMLIVQFLLSWTYFCEEPMFYMIALLPIWSSCVLFESGRVESTTYWCICSFDHT